MFDLKPQYLLVELHRPLQVLYDEAYVLEAVYLQLFCVHTGLCSG